MSQTTIGKHNKLIDEYECSGNGPRPPVPGEEARLHKMTETSSPAAMTFSTTMAPSISQSSSATNPHDLIAEQTRVAKWQEKLSNLLSDKKGVELFQRFVESEAGPHGIHTIHLEFYFACEGLKQQTDENIIRQIIGAIYRKYLRKEIQVSTELRNTIKRINKGEIPANANILDTVQKSVENTISQTTYPSFLKSDLYREFVEELQNAVTTGSFIVPSASLTASSSSSSSTTSLSSYDSLGACSTSLQEQLTKNSILPTLHEDSELAFAEDAAAKSLASSKPKLTKDLLLATQKRRLEVRPPGAHGYNISFFSSYNPVSRVDSERQSCSSGQTDSETKSLVSSKDGQPYSHRKQTSSESSVNAVKKGSVFVNPNFEANQSVIGPVPRSRLMKASNPYQLDPKLFYNELWPKLEKLKEDQETQERLERALTVLDQTHSKSSTALSMPSNISTSVQRETQAHQKALAAAIFKKFSQTNEDNDQDILDQHVSRVFSPHLSPGTISPCQAVSSRPLPPVPQRALESGTEISVTANTQSMRHSKSVPEHAASTSRKLSNKWPSMNYDSGISLYSADLPYKSKETRSSREQQLEETRKILEDESRRPRRQGSQQLPTQSNTAQDHHSSTLPRTQESTEFTYAVYTFCDETLRYRTKIPGTNPTLKQFKEYLPKKGNFRFFFKTVCNDPDCPIIQEEIRNDNDPLPLFDDKIMGTVKPE